MLSICCRIPQKKWELFPLIATVGIFMSSYFSQISASHCVFAVNRNHCYTWFCLLLKLLCGCLFECNCNAGDCVVVGPSLESRKHGVVDSVLQIIHDGATWFRVTNSQMYIYSDKVFLLKYSWNTGIAKKSVVGKNLSNVYLYQYTLHGTHPKKEACSGCLFFNSFLTLHRK